MDEVVKGMTVEINGDASSLKAELQEVVDLAEKACKAISICDTKAKRLKALFGAEISEERMREIVREEIGMTKGDAGEVVDWLANNLPMIIPEYTQREIRRTGPNQTD